MEAICLSRSIWRSCHGVLAWGCRAFLVRPNIPALFSSACGKIKGGAKYSGCATPPLKIA